MTFENPLNQQIQQSSPDIQQVFWLAKHDNTYKIKIFSVLVDFVRIWPENFNEEKARIQ